MKQRFPRYSGRSNRHFWLKITSLTKGRITVIHRGDSAFFLSYSPSIAGRDRFFVSNPGERTQIRSVPSYCKSLHRAPKNPTRTPAFRNVLLAWLEMAAMMIKLMNGIRQHKVRRIPAIQPCCSIASNKVKSRAIAMTGNANRNTIACSSGGARNRARAHSK